MFSCIIFVEGLVNGVHWHCFYSPTIVLVSVLGFESLPMRILSLGAKS
jgi:hypothetical protein